MRLTLGTAKTTVARALGTCTTDARVLSIINEAQERLLYKGKWKGTYGTYRFCSVAGCITLPRQLETVEAWALCRSPGIVRNGWYEFIEGGFGVLTESDQLADTLIDKGNVVSFDDVIGSGKHIRVISDIAETTSPTIILQGYDDSDNWIRTFTGGAWIDGEKLAVSNAYSITTNHFKSLVGVIKSATNGVVRIYEYDPLTGTQKALAYYEPDETHPEYRRYLIPGLSDVSECCTTTNEDGTECSACGVGTLKKDITVVAKHRYIPAATDNDWLMIGNLNALKLMCMAIQKEEQNGFQEGMILEGKAVAALQEELGHWLGDGNRVSLNIQNQSIGSPGAILTLM